MRTHRAYENMKYLELQQHINNVLSGEENLRPVYVVYGDDDYLSSGALKIFEGMVSSDYKDFNFIKLASEQDVNDAVDALETFPIFDSYKVVILPLQNSLATSKKSKKSKASDEVEQGESIVKSVIEKYLQAPCETSVFVLYCESKEVATSAKFKGAEIVDCSRLDEEALIKEITKIALTPPARHIERDAAMELILRTQNSMGRIVSEMTKLKAYQDSRITRKDVMDMVASDLDYKMYELANAVSSKNADTALSVLNVFFENGLRGMTIINLLYGKYRELLHASLNKDMPNDELAKLIGLNSSGAVYYLKKASQNYSQVKLKRSVDYLHALQYDVLSGKRNENSAVHEAVLHLLAL